MSIVATLGRVWASWAGRNGAHRSKRKHWLSSTFALFRRPESQEVL